MSVTLIENFRAVFYAPFYAAFALGAYKDEGLDVQLEMSSSADKTLTGVLTGDRHVSWGGPMRLLHALDENPKNGLVSFCEVVGRDPFYLLGREKNENFCMNDLSGKAVAVVSEVPTPWYCLQNDLRIAGIDPSTIRRTPNRSMSENLELLRTGEVDVVQVFEPLAHIISEEGFGHIWYAASSRGPTSYTTLNTTRGFLERNPDIALRMTRAIYRTQKWITAHTGHELAESISDYFPEIKLKTLAACCRNYKIGGVWNNTPIQQRAGFERLSDAMYVCKAIRTKFEYEDLSDMHFAEMVIHEDPPSI